MTVLRSVDGVLTALQKSLTSLAARLRCWISTPPRSRALRTIRRRPRAKSYLTLFYGRSGSERLQTRRATLLDRIRSLASIWGRHISTKRLAQPYVRIHTTLPKVISLPTPSHSLIKNLPTHIPHHRPNIQSHLRAIPRRQPRM